MPRITATTTCTARVTRSLLCYAGCHCSPNTGGKLSSGNRTWPSFFHREPETLISVMSGSGCDGKMKRQVHARMRSVRLQILLHCKRAPHYSAAQIRSWRRYIPRWFSTRDAFVPLTKVLFPAQSIPTRQPRQQIEGFGCFAMRRRQASIDGLAARQLFRFRRACQHTG